MKNRFLHGAILQSAILNIIKETPENSKYGYAINKSLKKKHNILLPHSTLYGELAKLEKEKLVKSEWDITSKKAKKQYKLTKKGENTIKQAFQEMKAITRPNQHIVVESAIIEKETGLFTAVHG